MSVKLKTYRGVDITVRDDGRFSAVIVHEDHRRPETVVTRDLRDVEQAIDASIPKKATIEPIPVLYARGGKTSRYPTYADIAEVGTALIVGVHRLQEGRGKNAYVRTRLVGVDGQVTADGSMFLDDPDVRTELRAIKAEADALLARWNAAVDRLTPITKDEIVARVDALDG